MKVLREVPSYVEIPVPKELLAEGKRQLVALCRLHVPFLELVVAACYIGVEAYGLRQPVKSELL